MGRGRWVETVFTFINSRDHARMLEAASLKYMLKYGVPQILIFPDLSTTKEMKSKVKSIRQGVTMEGIEAAVLFIAKLLVIFKGKAYIF